MSTSLGDLLVLLHGARARWQTLQATHRTWTHAARSHEAKQRAAAWSGWGSAFYPVGSEPSTAWERRERIWLTRGQVRVEGDGTSGPILQIVDGDRWWVQANDDTVHTNDGDPSHGFAVAPADLLVDPSPLVAGFDLEALGDRAHAGHAAVAARAIARRRRHHDGRVLPLLGADHVDLLVHAERGIVLRLSSVVDGEPADVEELLDVRFDEPLARSLFTFEPASGMRVITPRTPRADKAVQLSLGELAEQAPFTVLALQPQPEGWTLAAHLVGADERLGLQAVAYLHYRSAEPRRTIVVEERAAGARWPQQPRRRWRHERHDGHDVAIADDPDRPGVAVQLTRDGTLLDVRADDLPPAALVDVALRLRPVT